VEHAFLSLVVKKRRVGDSGDDVRELACSIGLLL